MWPMPLDDDYKEYLKSAFADLPNIGGRWGGAITAAMFLKEFADDDALGAPGHRRHGVARRRQAVPGQGSDGRAGAHAGAAGDGLAGIAHAYTAAAPIRSITARTMRSQRAPRNRNTCGPCAPVRA